MSSGGTKVTTDPESTRKPVHEGAGVVTSDSLAAESHDEGGKFSEKPGLQPSHSTTTNTTDTSNAIEVGPDDPDKKEDEVYTGPPSGGKAAGVGPTYHTQGSGSKDRVPASTSSETKAAGDESKSEGKGSETKGDGTQSSSGTGPAFEGNEPNASFNAEIGSKDDPGRVGLEQIQRRNAEDARDSGIERDHTEIGGKTGEYDTLKNETEA